MAKSSLEMSIKYCAIPQVSVDVEEQNVEPSLIAFQFFEQHERDEHSAEQEERIDRDRSVFHGLEFSSISVLTDRQLLLISHSFPQVRLS